MSATVRMESHKRYVDKLTRRTSTPSPNRKSVTVRDWLDTLGLTEYSHLFAAYRSMQVSNMMNELLVNAVDNYPSSLA